MPGDSFVKPDGGSAKGGGGIAGLMVRGEQNEGGHRAENQRLFNFQRKRKRRVFGNKGGGDHEDKGEDSTVVCDDAASVASLDLSPPPESKRSKRGAGLSRMTSLASVISTPVAKMGHALQRL